jgi:tetratricopeptide (TPR) repeat protein
MTPEDRAPWLAHAGCLTLIVLLTATVFWPTVGNGFLLLGFDDLLITDNESIRELGWRNLSAMATRFEQAHYVPLTMLSLAFDHQIWGLDPRGFHVTNVVLHALAACAAYGFVFGLTGRASASLLAALVFALHPVQMEAVSIAIQRKTVLSGALFFLTLVLYQRWRSTGQWAWYAASLAAFAAAGLAKPMVVTLPLILLLYEHAVAAGQRRCRDTLPFFLVAAPIVAAAVAAHAAVGALHPPHGGSWLAHVLMMSRVTLEQVTALLLPCNLSPIYYYRRDLAFALINWAALAAIVLAVTYVTLKRRLRPWHFFCLAWFIITLAPESNVIPLAQLRADRFLYLPVIALAVLVAVEQSGLGSRGHVRVGRWRVFAVPVVYVALLAVLTRQSAGVWKDDVSAWTAVVARHPWSSVAHQFLGRALLDRGDLVAAEGSLLRAVVVNPQLPEPHLQLAKIYAAQGRRDLARRELELYRRQAPNDPEGLTLWRQLEAPAAP